MANPQLKLNNSNTRSFFKGAFVLTVSMILVKFCGLLQKILLTNLYSTMGAGFGEFGSGLISNAYELYVPLYTLATMGLPIAVSRMVSLNFARGRYRDVKGIYKLSLPIFITSGVVCTLLMILGSFVYVRYIDSPYSMLSIFILSPTVLLGCLISLYRGYFEGLRNMAPTALSEIIESLAKIAIGVFLSYIVIDAGSKEYALKGTVFSLTFNDKDEAMRTLVSFSVAASILGVTAGCFLSFLYLRIRFAVKKGEIPEAFYCTSPQCMPKGKMFINLISCALPVGIGALVLSFANTADGAIINRVLKNMVTNNPDELFLRYPALHNEIYNSGTAHTCIWGYYGACLTVLSIVISFSQVFGTSALPNVTDAYAKGDKRSLATSIQTVLRFTVVFSMPCAFGLCVLAGPVLKFIFFANPNISVYGEPVLQILSLASLFIGVCTPVSSMLQAVGKAKTTMFIYVFGTTFKVILSYYFVRNIDINIAGTAIGSLISNMLMCVFACYSLVKATKVTVDFISVFLKPLISSIACAMTAYVTYYIFSTNLIISVVISAIIYLAFLLMLHTFSKEEIKILLNSKKIVIILEKLHLIG